MAEVSAPVEGVTDRLMDAAEVRGNTTTVFFFLVAIGAGIWLLNIQPADLTSALGLLAAASIAAGVVIGFLFGIPRVLQGDAPEVREVAASGAQSGESMTRVSRMQVNTNLEQISDWLTKIIVGLGLIELKSASSHVETLLLLVLGPNAVPAARGAVVSVTVYFSIIGFLFGYLVTRLYLSGAFKRADDTLLVAGRRVSRAQVSKQVRDLIGDLQDQVLELKAQQPGIPGPTTSERVEATAGGVRALLWVDDSPSNNSLIIERLASLGITTTTALSTKAALKYLSAHKVDRIISDMGRREGMLNNPTAGLELLRGLREMGVTSPVVIYCSREAARSYRQEALAHGARAVTSSTTELLAALEIAPRGADGSKPPEGPLPVKPD